MIYLDSAATSFQKPSSVRSAVNQALMTMSSPGRGAYASAMKAADTLLECRLALAEMFHVQNPESVVFTASATQAINTAVFSLLKPGDRVVISGYEHNAVVRPLVALGARIDIAAAPLFDTESLLQAFGKKTPGAAAVICSHVSNVFGWVLPLDEIADLCRQHKIPLVVDASQSAGVLPLDFSALDATYVAMPGHKGLFGPQGTGVLLCKEPGIPLLYGGTGSHSSNPEMPPFLPDRLEAGTHNVPGIAGLLSGLRWLKQKGIGRVFAHEQMLMRRFASYIAGNKLLNLFLSEDPARQSGLLSLQPKNMDCEELARQLGEKGVAVRAGLHCAPAAHRSAGTLEKGTVRFSFSPFNTTKETLTAAAILMDIAR